jgi:hypothetical protein
MHSVTELTTVDGSVIDVELASPLPTVSEVCDALVASHGFRKGVRLMTGGKLIGGERLCADFPAGALIIVGARAQAKSPTPQSSPASEQPASGSTRNNTTRMPSISPSRRQKPLPADHIAVTVLVPATDTRHTLHLHQAATVSDLVTHLLAKEPTLHNSRFVFHGHELTNRASELRHYGVGNGAMVHAVARNLDPTSERLLEAQRSLKEMRSTVEKGADETTRKAFFEKAMRLLFSLDDLSDLEGEQRLARKALVHEISAFQDSLGIHQSPK